MKQSDFDRLKSVYEKEGFDITMFNPHDTTFAITKKDIWGGVEFVIPNHNSTLTKLPYKIVGLKNGFVQVHCPYSGNGNITQIQELEVNPCSESAYVEQLKKEAFERFGEIKEGDRFISESGFSTAYLRANVEWDYFKPHDQLFYYNVEVYKKGIWATRVPERVKVKWINWGWAKDLNNVNLEFSIKHIDWTDVKDKDEVGDFLASKLEKYLNGEIKE